MRLRDSERFLCENVEKIWKNEPQNVRNVIFVVKIYHFQELRTCSEIISVLILCKDLRW